MSMTVWALVIMAVIVIMMILAPGFGDGDDE
jgi:hypothetical protein